MILSFGLQYTKTDRRTQARLETIHRQLCPLRSMDEVIYRILMGMESYGKNELGDESTDAKKSGKGLAFVIL